MWYIWEKSTRVYNRSKTVEKKTMISDSCNTQGRISNTKKFYELKNNFVARPVKIERKQRLKAKIQKLTLTKNNYFSSML